MFLVRRDDDTDGLVVGERDARSKGVGKAGRCGDGTGAVEGGFFGGVQRGGVEEYIETPCPKCQSKETFFRELNKPVAYTSLFFGVPLPLKRAGWRCHSCGYQWQENGAIH